MSNKKNWTSERLKLDIFTGVECYKCGKLKVFWQNSMYLFLAPTTNKPQACLTVFKTYGAKNKYIKNFAKNSCAPKTNTLRILPKTVITWLENNHRRIF